MIVKLKEGARFVPHGAVGFESFDLWERLVRKGQEVEVPDTVYQQYKEHLEVVTAPVKGKKVKDEPDTVAG